MPPLRSILFMAVIAGVFLKVLGEIFARRTSPVDESVPSGFDVVKELNAHAGRLASVLGFLVAGTSFTFTNGAVRDALALPSQGRLPVYLALAWLGLSLFGATAYVLAAMHPPLPRYMREQTWQGL